MPPILGNTTTTGENTAAPLTGSELIRGVQSGANVKMTAQDIADLGYTSPSTATGDLIVHGSGADQRLAVGANGAQLIADSTQPLGVRWYDASGAAFTTLVSSLISATGSAMVGIQQPGTGGQLRTLHDETLERVSLFGFLTPAQIIDVQSGTPTLDLTTRIQQAVTAAVGKKLLVNAGTYGVTFPGVNGLCIDVPSNSCIEFEAGAMFKALAHNNTIYQMLRVWDQTNVTIIRPRLNGNKAVNAAVTGEFGMGIDIRGGRKIHVIDPYTINTWGDGIYLGISSTNAHPTDVVVDTHYASGCRRQGVSITDGINVIFGNPVWENIGGVAPGAGLDIEPDSNLNEIQGIRILNPKTKNCVFGIDCYLGTFGGATAKNVDIEISNHIDDGSAVGCSIGGANTAGGTHRIDGKITTTRPLFMNNTAAAFQSVEHDALGPLIEVIRPSVIDPNRSAGTSPRYSAPFSVLRDTGSTLTYAIGNCRIIEPSIVLRSGSIPNVFSAQDAVNGSAFVSGVYFLDPLELVGMTNNAMRGFFPGKGNISDRYGVWAFQSTGAITLDYSLCAPILADSASQAITLADPTAAGSIAGSPDIIIRQPNALDCTVGTASGGHFVGQAVGKRLQMNAGAGSYIRLRPQGSNVYAAVEEVGAVAVV